MKLVKYIGDIIDQTKKRRLSKEGLKSELEKLSLEAQKVEDEYEIAKSRSLVLVAKEIAKYKFQLINCNSCQKIKTEKVKLAIANYPKVGSVEEQIMNGEMFINQGPYKEISYINFENKKENIELTF